MCDVQEDHYLYGFSYSRTLSEDRLRKSIVILGTAPVKTEENDERRENVIITIEKSPLDERFVAGLQNGSGDDKGSETVLNVTEELGENDVYRWCKLHIGVGDGGYKATVIRPATDAHIKKYTKQELVMVTESAQTYAQIVRPWIESQPAERIQWVYNILDKKKEADTILYEKTGSDDGFIIVPDMKWDAKTVNALYLVAIVHDRSLRSLRDLTAAHIPMLESIAEQGARTAKEKYGLDTHSTRAGDLGALRCFIHYHPTYYHFHVHLLTANYDSHPGAVTGQAHLLQDVVDLLKLGVDFKQRTLTYSMAVNHPLFQHMRATENTPEPEPKKQRVEG